MKKPAWVSFFGWAFLFCVCVWLSAGVMTWHQPANEQTKMVVVPALLFGPAFFMLWLLGSLKYSFQKRSAELHAATVAEAMRQAKQQGVPAPVAVPKPFMTSPLGLTGTDKK